MSTGQMGAGRAVSAGGIRLAYLESGAADAPPMLLLHGLGERGSDWAAVTPQFAGDFRVIALDLRGHGDSDWPGSYSFQLMRDDVLGAIGQLGLGAVTLVGHSMGGAVAFLAAIQRPDLIGRLIVEDATPPFPRVRTLPERPDGPLDFDWPAVTAINLQLRDGDPAAWEGLGAITAPTLLIGGGPDSHIPQDKLAEVAARIPRCDLVTIPAGHQVHSSRPEEFTRTILGWLRASHAA